MMPAMASSSSADEFENSASSSSSSSSSAIATVHPDIIHSHILTRLDGPTLASAASTSSQLRRLCTEHHLWRNICTAMWPSLKDPLATALISTFPAAHRSIFSDSFPSLHHSSNSHHHQDRLISSPPPSELISAVDIYYKDKPVFSRVHRMETRKGWFLCSPLWVDLLDPNELVPTPLKFVGNDEEEWLKHLEENLSLSWIMIDPTRKRAANLSSRTPVSVRRHWLTGEQQVLYAVMMAGETPSSEMVQCGIKVTCCGKVGGEMHVREVSLTMEDMEGRHVIGRESMVILQRAIESGKRKKVDGGEEAKKSFEKFCCMKRERRERKLRKEKAQDMVVMWVALTIFALLFWFLRLCV